MYFTFNVNISHQIYDILNHLPDVINVIWILLWRIIQKSLIICCKHCHTIYEDVNILCTELKRKVLSIMRYFYRCRHFNQISYVIWYFEFSKQYDSISLLLYEKVILVWLQSNISRIGSIAKCLTACNSVGDIKRIMRACRGKLLAYVAH